MTSLLIVESNTPDIVASGKSASAGFLCSLAGSVPDAVLTVVSPYAGAVPDSAMDGVDGVIFTGSGVAWAANAPEAAPLQDFMARVFDRGLPVFGSCNGLQLAAAVLGGAVGASPVGFEVGVARDTRLTEEGRTHPMMAGREDGFAVPCIHRDEVQSLPEGAVVLAKNVHSPVQVMVFEQGRVSFWGTQYHPELMARDIANYLSMKEGHSGPNASLISDLDASAMDEAAALRIGTSVAALALPVRARELTNWVTMVQERKA